MKWITFEDCKHNFTMGDYKAEYAIDWTTAEHRKYKEPISGLRVYEAGFMQLNRNGDYNPHFRSALEREFGIELTTPHNMKYKKFFDQETGEPIRKEDLPHENMFYDRKRGRLYAVANWGVNITFYGPDAQPSAQKQIKYAVRDKVAEKKLFDSMQEVLALGKTLLAVGNFSAHWNIPALITAFVAGNLSDLSHPEAQKYCASLALNLTETRNAITKHCLIKKEGPYINVKDA